MSPTGQLTRAIVLLFGLAVLGTSGYVIIEGWSIFDALYATLATLTTVGVGEGFTVSPMGRAFTMFLMVTGIGGVLYTLTIIMQYVIEGELGSAVWRRRMKGRIEQLTDHYIICGYGRVGRQVANEFRRENIPFVVIDINEESIKRCGEDGFLYVPGDAASDDVLRSAGIERARGLVTAVDNDANNVYVTLSARGLRPDLFIVARGNIEASEPKLLRAGANRVLSPYSIAGRRLAMLALRPVVIDFIDTVMHSENLELLLESVEVGPSSPILGKSIKAARERKAEGPYLLALKKKSGRMDARPNAEAVIELGDHLVVIGTQAEMRNVDRVF